MFQLRGWSTAELNAATELGRPIETTFETAFGLPGDGAVAAEDRAARVLQREHRGAVARDEPRERRERVAVRRVGEQLRGCNSSRAQMDPDAVCGQTMFVDRGDSRSRPFCVRQFAQTPIASAIGSKRRKLATHQAPLVDLLVLRQQAVQRRADVRVPQRTDGRGRQRRRADPCRVPNTPRK